MERDVNNGRFKKYTLLRCQNRNTVYNHFRKNPLAKEVLDDNFEFRLTISREDASLKAEHLMERLELYEMYLMGRPTEKKVFEKFMGDWKKKEIE